MMNTRKNIRLQNYNYSNNGVYFVTICTKDKRPTLSKIVGDGILDVPQCNVIEKENVKVRLTNVGNIVKEIIEHLSKHNRNIEIEKYVIMPNHIHLLISISSDNGTSGKPSPTQNNIKTRANEVIPKLISSLKRYSNKKTGVDLWQRSYYDHIIRDEKDYQAKWT